MRTKLLPLGLALLVGCSPPPPPPVTAATPPADTVLNLKQLMEWVIDPTVDVIWDSVKSISTQAGTKEISPQTDEQWIAVRNAAAALTEAGNLLMLPGRARDDKDWAVAARALVRTSEKAL